MRLAPGEPIAKVAPSSCQATMGDMFETQSASGRNAEISARVEFWFSKAIVTGNSCSRNSDARAIAIAHSDRHYGAIAGGRAHVHGVWRVDFSQILFQPLSFQNLIRSIGPPIGTGFLAAQRKHGSLAAGYGQNPFTVTHIFGPL